MDIDKKNGSVKIEDTDMYYISFGRGKKKLVVLPGLSDGLATVKGKSMILAGTYKRFFDDYTVYMFSRKNKMPKDYSIRDMARDQVIAMKELEIEKSSVLGVSQGGMIAQYIAINYPEIMNKLILAVTAPYANSVINNSVLGWIKIAERDDHVSLMIDTAEKMYSEAFLNKFGKLIPLMAKITRPKSYERFFRNAYAILEFDAREELYKINCPTLIIAGDDDKTVGKDACNELNQKIKGSEIFVYEGLGHGAFEEAKDFYDRVYDFCQK